MQDSILYIIIMISLIVLIVSLEWEKIKQADLKKVVIILIILFFLGSALIPLFT